MRRRFNFYCRILLLSLPDRILQIVTPLESDEQICVCIAQPTEKLDPLVGHLTRIPATDDSFSTSNGTCSCQILIIGVSRNDPATVFTTAVACGLRGHS